MTVTALRLKLASLRGLTKAIESAPPWNKIAAATQALAVADELLSMIVERIERLEESCKKNP